LDLGQTLRHLGDEPCHHRAGAPELFAQGVVGSVHHVLAHGFDEGEVGDAAFGLVALAEQHLRPAESAVLTRALGQPRLADAGLARQHHERAVAA
jgi:hypothetical protein